MEISLKLKNLIRKLAAYGTGIAFLGATIFASAVA